MSKIKLSDHFTAGRLFRFVLPSVAMMVFISIYGVVDGFFVSNFAGKTSFASINLIMPFVMILGGVGFMVGTGGTTLVSQKLGEGDEKTAKRYFTMMIMLTVILGAVLTTFGLIFTENVAVFFGATPEMLGDCVLYGRIVISFTTAFMLQNVFQSFFIAAEKPKLGLISTIMAGCTNIILDAVFVGLMDFGVAGAAFATGISECVGGIFPLIYFLRPNSVSYTHLDVYKRQPCICEYYFYLSVGVYRLYTECECVDTTDNLGDTLSGNITDVVLLCLHTCNDTCKVTSLVYLTEVG